MTTFPGLKPLEELPPTSKFEEQARRQHKFINLRRPWLDDCDRSWVYYHGSPRSSEVRAPLTIPQWEELDKAVARVVGYRLSEQVKGILRSHTVIEMSCWDSMMAEFEKKGKDETHLLGVPLPITHSDIEINERRLSTLRHSEHPIDTTMAEAATRRVCELVNKTVEEMCAREECGLILSQPMVVVQRRKEETNFRVLCGMTAYPLSIGSLRVREER